VVGTPIELVVVDVGQPYQVSVEVDSFAVATFEVDVGSPVLVEVLVDVGSPVLVE
jgi:hypothetical protein